MLRSLKFLKPHMSLIQSKTLATTSANSITSINHSHLARVCTILYQQQNAPNTKLHASLAGAQFHLTREFFLQVCNNFPYSWRPIYRFHLYSLTRPDFTHCPTTFNKILDTVGKSRNIDLFWELCGEIGKLGLANVKTCVIALRTLADARELKKCVGFFQLMSGLGYDFVKVETFNKVVEFLCKNKLVNEAKYVVLKLKDSMEPNSTTYRWLAHGFCDVGDLIEASKVWNLMVNDGLEPEIDMVDIMLEALFKKNMFDEGLKLFQSLRAKGFDDLGISTYRIVIKWLCKRGKVGESYVFFEEMKVKGLKPDSVITGSLVYALLSRGRTNEAYRVYQEIENPDIIIYHSTIKGLLRLKRASEATQVFRDMINRGCEPTMHTYVMLLQGHLGKRGRKGDDPLINFDTIFLGGLVKVGKSYEALKYVERVMDRGLVVPRFDYNKFLHYFSNDEGVLMFQVMAGKLREVGSFDLADIFQRYGEKMATRDRRRDREIEKTRETEASVTSS